MSVSSGRAPSMGERDCVGGSGVARRREISSTRTLDVRALAHLQAINSPQGIDYPPSVTVQCSRLGEADAQWAYPTVDSSCSPSPRVRRTPTCRSRKSTRKPSAVRATEITCAPWAISASADILANAAAGACDDGDGTFDAAHLEFSLSGITRVPTSAEPT